MYHFKSQGPFKSILTQTKVRCRWLERQINTEEINRTRRVHGEKYLCKGCNDKCFKHYTRRLLIELCHILLAVDIDETPQPDITNELSHITNGGARKPSICEIAEHKLQA